MHVSVNCHAFIVVCLFVVNKSESGYNIWLEDVIFVTWQKQPKCVGKCSARQGGGLNCRINLLIVAQPQEILD